jgi:hypothetical protein
VTACGITLKDIFGGGGSYNQRQNKYISRIYSISFKFDSFLRILDPKPDLESARITNQIYRNSKLNIINQLLITNNRNQISIESPSLPKLRGSEIKLNPRIWFRGVPS